MRTPQSGQKSPSIVLPLSALRLQRLGRPDMYTSAGRGTTADMAKALPDWR
jgi:hypothetical protein